MGAVRLISPKRPVCETARLDLGAMSVIDPSILFGGGGDDGALWGGGRRSPQ